ncbi:MAG: hypothetical protein HZB42_02375 [Sphingobacteriales bacterium]|nr:hypothetical protein [Sphingobacteriales bacterium]
MPVRRDIPYNRGLFFITFTCHKWLPLIEQTNSYDLVYNWFSQATSPSADFSKV